MRKPKVSIINAIINFIKRLLPSILGILSALVILELCLRPFALRDSYVIYPDQYSLEKFKNYKSNNSKATEIRQFGEGFAISHFREEGDRFTGVDHVENIPNNVILGDSMVEALQVEDSQTMGAVLERLAAKGSKPMNVHQYGWSGISTATYVAIADTIKQKWNPQWVAVVLNAGDLSKVSLTTGPFWRIEINSETSSYKVLPVERLAKRLDERLKAFGLTSRDVYNLINSSALLYLVIEKYLLSANLPKDNPDNPNQNIENSSKDSSEQKIVTSIIVKALKEAYGEKLLIVYVPQIGVTSSKELEPVENLLQSACENENVNFISTRNAMITKRDEENLISQGFFNTVPGVGHLNQIGHEVVAEEIWKKVSNY